MSKDNINLPKTAFSMKANLPAKEPGLVQYWDEIKLYENGILVNSTPLQGPLAQNTFNGSAGIGVSAAHFNGWYNGNIA